MNNLLKCIGFKGYNFCEEPLQPKENFYENDIKRKFYQCKKCRISRQKYIAAYIKTRLSLWKNDARVGLKKILYGEAIESFNLTNEPIPTPVIREMRKAPEYDYPEFPDEVKKELEETASHHKCYGSQDTRGWVYLLANPAWTHLKIGTAFDLKKRLSQYQTGAPDRDYKYLHISAQFYDDSYKAEKEIHNALDPYRIKGTEWFNINEEQGTKAIEDYGLRS
jgi:hypothetical protein